MSVLKTTLEHIALTTPFTHDFTGRDIPQYNLKFDRSEVRAASHIARCSASHHTFLNSDWKEILFVVKHEL